MNKNTIKLGIFLIYLSVIIMTHADLTALFIKYYQEYHPERRIFPNRTGWAVYGKQYVPYGIPAPARGVRKKLSGGGPDLISFGPVFSSEGCYFTAEFYELKTLKDNLRPNQKHFADWIVKNDGRYFIVKEDDTEMGFEILPYLK